MKNDGITPGEGLFDDFRREMGSFLDKGISLMESEQAKINKAFFAALTMEQRDVFCQTLRSEGVKPSKMPRITGKSQPTINRHLNGKNS